MAKHLVFLIELDMAAHHDDGLPHQEHEYAAYQRQHQYGDTAKRDDGNGFIILRKIDEPFYQNIIVGRFFILIHHAEGARHHFKHITRYLGSEYGEIVGNNDEQNSQDQAIAVFIEKRIK